MEADQQQNQLFQALLQAGLNLPEDKKFYFNAFAIAFTPADMLIVLQYNDHPIATLTVSHTVAKGLAELILENINNFQKQTNSTVFSINELTKRMMDQTHGESH